LPKFIRIPPSGEITIVNSANLELKLKTNQTSYLTQLIYWDGGYLNFEYAGLFISLIKKVNTFYDIGANIGFYSLIAAQENAGIKVVGFEPALGPLFYFRENVRINKFKNIQIESIALSHQVSGEIEFYEVSNKKYKYLKYNLAGENNAGSKKVGRNFKLNKVFTTTLDSFVYKENEGMIDLIKIDTEGTENLILDHSSEVLCKMKPIIICETLFNTIEKELETIFMEHGYEFFNHTDKGLIKVDSIVRSEDNGIRNCFFVHPTKFHLVKEYVVN
jgi:FkbM family methyltransferase